MEVAPRPVADVDVHGRAREVGRLRRRGPVVPRLVRRRARPRARRGLLPQTPRLKASARSAAPAGSKAPRWPFNLKRGRTASPNPGASSNESYTPWEHRIATARYFFRATCRSRSVGVRRDGIKGQHDEDSLGSRSLNIVVMLAALSLVAQLGCSGDGSSTDGGHDTKVDKPAGNNNKPDVGDRSRPRGLRSRRDAKPVCADGGARAVTGEACGCAATASRASASTAFVATARAPTRASGATSRARWGRARSCPRVCRRARRRRAPWPTVATCGTDGTCDGQGACRKYVDGTVCQPGTCNGAAVTNIKTCDGAGTCARAPPRSACRTRATPTSRTASARARRTPTARPACSA